MPLPAAPTGSAPALRLTTRGVRVLLAAVVLLVALTAQAQLAGADRPAGPLPGLHVAPGIALGLPEVREPDGSGR